MKIARYLPLASLLVVLALPLGMLAWVQSHRDQTLNTVPIAGFDPRDLLRGRYLTFAYIWDRASYTPENPPVSGRYYVDERDAHVLETALRLSAPSQNLSTAVVHFRMTGPDVTPVDLTLAGHSLTDIADCAHNSPLVPLESAVQTCLQAQ